MPTGATTSVDETALREAVQGILAAVPGLLKAADRPGARTAWEELKGLTAPKVFAEVSIGSSRETLVSAGNVEERPTIQVDLWLPFSYDDNSERSFDAVRRAVKDALRAAHYLGQAAGVLVDDYELPQTTFNGRDVFHDGEHEVGCHHAVITEEVLWEFSYSFNE
jgi:hypothetical protein